jgi:hypothetical protein
MKTLDLALFVAIALNATLELSDDLQSPVDITHIQVSTADPQTGSPRLGS